MGLGRASQGPTVQWLRDTARRLGIWLGTSYLEASGEDFFNTFVLVTPSGDEAGRVRKQTPAMYEPWFFRGQPGSHVITTELGTIGVGICNDNHRSYLPSLLQHGGADLVLMPHCWPLPKRPKGVVSERDLRRWHEIQTGLAPLYAKLLGVPAVFVNKVGPYASPAPVRWLPAAADMTFPGHATIADSDGTVVAQLSDAEGVITASVTLDPNRKQGRRRRHSADSSTQRDRPVPSRSFPPGCSDGSTRTARSADGAPHRVRATCRWSMTLHSIDGSSDPHLAPPMG